nr:hypothetical protein [Nocardioides convexus]
MVLNTLTRLGRRGPRRQAAPDPPALRRGTGRDRHRRGRQGHHPAHRAHPLAERRRQRRGHRRGD